MADLIDWNKFEQPVEKMSVNQYGPGPHRKEGINFLLASLVKIESKHRASFFMYYLRDTQRWTSIFLEAMRFGDRRIAWEFRMFLLISGKEGLPPGVIVISEVPALAEKDKPKPPKIIVPDDPRWQIKYTGLTGERGQKPLPRMTPNPAKKYYR